MLHYFTLYYLLLSIYFVIVQIQSAMQQLLFCICFGFVFEFSALTLLVVHQKGL